MTQNPVDSITCQKKHTCFLPSRPHPTNLESDADRWPNYMEGSFLVHSESHGFHRFFFQKEQPVLEWLTWKSIVTQSSLVLALPANGKLWQKMLDQHLQTCKGQLSNIFKWFNYVKITEEKNGYFDFQGSMDVLFKLKRRSISGW